MQPPDDIRRDLPPDLESSEAEQLVALARRLHGQTPVPAPNFRGDLRRRLLGGSKGPRTNPGTTGFTRLLAASYAVSGLLLLVVAGVGVAGVGPFAT
jgi:hypothetical protein